MVLSLPRRLLGLEQWRPRGRGGFAFTFALGVRVPVALMLRPRSFAMFSASTTLRTSIAKSNTPLTNALPQVRYPALLQACTCG